MRSRTVAIIASFLAYPCVARTQARPDFSGEWTRVDSAAEQRSVATVGDGAFRAGDMGSGWGSPLTLRQEANRFVVEYTYFSTYDLQPKVTFAYAVDGSESRNTIMIGHAASVARSRATWRDSTLVITTTWPAPRGVTGAEVRQVLTLESPTSLLIETTRGTTTTRTRYRKG